MLGDGARPRRPGGGTPGAAAFGAASGVGDKPGVACGEVSAWMPFGAEQDALESGLGATGMVPSEELAAPGVPGVPDVEFGAPGVPGVLDSEFGAAGVPGVAGTVLGALGMAGVPGVVGDRLEGGAAPSPTSGSNGAPGVWAGIPAGRTIASSCPLVNLMP
jgi:hypothetical protein